VTSLDPAQIALAEMLFNARRALAYARRGGARWYDDELIVDAVANRIR
jgi:hypothetical protein